MKKRCEDTKWIQLTHDKSPMSFVFVVFSLILYLLQYNLKWKLDKWTV